MFPLGIPGVALLLLRISVAAAFTANQMAPGWDAGWMLICRYLAAIAIAAGLLTPYCWGFFCLLALGSAERHGCANQLSLLLLVLNGVAAAMLGPGGYSLDALIFGRRRLSGPPRRTPTRR